MKRISLLCIMLALAVRPAARAQDAATEERLNRLGGKIEDLIAAQGEQDKRITALTREIAELREQLGKPNASYASQDELRRLGEAVKEVDRKRMDDNERIHSELLKLGKSLAQPSPAPKKPAAAPPASNDSDSKAPAAGGDKGLGFTYKVQQGDRLSTIAQAYREKNIKVTVDQILKANPGLVAEKLKVGQEIWIPAPTQTQ
jgi:LysM repeat protein/uncharacterized small protein (DUF1192 family)